MTATSYDPPSSAPPNRGPDVPGAVLLSVTGPTAQRRLTVAIRVILAMPHVLALYALGIAASVVLVMGWPCALFIGRLPGFAAGYLSGYLRWYCRVAAYLLLLTDDYPLFTFADAAYPVRAAVSPGKLRRLTVLARAILAIPAGIVSALLVSVVMTIVILIAWLIALAAGRLPAALHQALTAVLRYTVRCNGYLYLLTDVYPAGLFGDDPDVQAGEALVDGPAGGYQAPDWRLVLSANARLLVRLFLVLGLIAVAGGGALAGSAINSTIQRDRQISQLNADVARHNSAVAQFNPTVAETKAAHDQVNTAIEQLINANYALYTEASSKAADSSHCTTPMCYDESDIPVVHAYDSFGRALRAMRIPASSAAIAKRLVADNAVLVQDWIIASREPSFDPKPFENKWDKDAVRQDNDYKALSKSLNKRQAALISQAGSLDEKATALNDSGAALKKRAAQLNVTVSVLTANQA
jgi:hypothetical protein